jgi:hypothetical protein
MKYRLAIGVLVAAALQIWIIRLGILSGPRQSESAAPSPGYSVPPLTNIPPPLPANTPNTGPRVTFQELSDYEIPAGSILYRSNPEQSPAASITAPAKISVAVVGRTDAASGELRCDGKFYLKVQSRQAPPRVYYVRPSVPYNPHLRMTWLQTKTKWPDARCG